MDCPALPTLPAPRNPGLSPGLAGADRLPVVLAILDESASPDSLPAHLAGRGYAVHTARDGRHGLALFQEHCPDLVVVVLGSPRSGNPAVLAAVARTSPTTPLIAAAGPGAVSGMAEALRMGAWDCLPLPVKDASALDHALGKALERADLLRARRVENERLEAEVRRRTAELTAANARLQTEIAERGRAEERLKASLEEKEVLLKEVHHRVKNNLQIISSLLYLQSQQAEDPIVQALFKESRSRIKSMALVHEKLYQSGDLARVDFGEYLQTFASYLMQAFHIPGRSVRLDLDLEQEKVLLPVDSAIPCSLAAAELLTNALKYAFAGREQGVLGVALTRNGDLVRMAVRDDGAGFPPGLDFRNTGTLGLQLVVNLVRQLRGELSMNSAPGQGTTFAVDFPCPFGRA